MRVRLHKTLIGVLCALAVAAAPLHGGEVAQANLDILGLGLEVDRNPVTTAVDIPSYVQTIFGGRTNDEAPPANGLSALGELTGPGIDSPITLVTTPGRPFALPALHEKGEYTLQNIRLVGAGGEFLQQAVPSFAVITVADVLKTQVRVRQLTAEELRERGIVVDSRNYEVYEYTFVFGVDQTTVEVPYPVIVDKRTHVVVPVPAENKYVLPPIPVNKKPPRFVPPEVIPMQLGGGPPPGSDTDTGPAPAPRPSIPAALVVPNGFGVLHQFFAVILQVENGAPDGSNIKLDSITATINAPLQLRVAKVMPAVAIGQPVPVKDEVTGQTFLVAGARGTAEWTLEALKAGTHSVNIEVLATYQKPGQDDVPLRGRVSTSLVVSDPRFHVNFSHPDTVRKDEKYTAYAFVTNLSPQRQHVQLDLSHIPACTSGAAVDNICREAGEAKEEFDLEPGEMRPVPYKLTSKITGRIFAAAGSANDEALGVSMRLTMGVSASGIPLSPATLLMPHYTQFLPSAFVEENMQFLGLAYSLSTAPLNQYTAKFPRLIKTDVFTRAQQIARAGQRIFITRQQRDANNPLENRDPFFHLALDLLGNPERLDQLETAPELREWDDLRRMEESGRRAGAAIARQLEINGFANNATPKQFVDAFAAATSHRTPFLFAYAHGPAVSGNARPYALSVKTLTSNLALDVPAEAESGWTRTLPYSELTALNGGGDVGELAMAGRWREEDFRISVKPAATSFTLRLIYPDQTNGTQLRTDINITNATVGVPVEIDIRRGLRTVIVKNAAATPIVDAIPQTPLDVVGAAQDLHLDPDGHIVTLLLNRPISVPDVKTLRDRFALTVNIPKASYSITRKNTASQLQIPGAALQDDAKIIAVTFDKTLSRNAQYELDYENVENDIVPRIDNDRPGAILTGKVLRGDNTPIPDVLVHLEMAKRADQIDITGADGRFLYEFVPRDIDSNLFGDYLLRAAAEGKTTSLEGAVRLPGEVHTVNLQFLGRGRATGQVRYSDGEVLPNVTVTVGSTLFRQYRRGKTNAQGHYDIGDLPVGPLTFSVTDKDGRPTFAANHIRTAGEVITQDLVIERKEAPGMGTVRVIVKRSDTNALVAGAQVGVWLQGYALQSAYTEADGAATFTNVPAGLVSIIAAEFGISRTGAGVEVELRKDQTLEQTLVLSVPNAQTQYATLDGTITRDDPAAPGDATKDQIVPGAIIAINGQPAVTAGEDGKYLYADLPLGASGAGITVFDPATGRRGFFTVPTLVAGSNRLSMKLRSAEPIGVATMRVRLSGARGESVSGYRVITPGYPPDKFTAKGSGVYELEGVRVPRVSEVVAVPVSADGAYGEQAVRGSLRVDFAGQLGITDLRLPGAGTIVVRTEIETGCSTPPCYAPAIGPASITYRVWDEAEQGFMAKTVTADPDPATGLVTFTKIPARQEVILATHRNPAGYATAKTTLQFDGDLQTIPLRLKTIGDVTGRVLSFDRITPVANATVRIFTKTATYAPAITAPDGTFRFPGIAADTPFTIVADLEEDGIYRTGRVDGKTPSGGGPVANLLIVMREQSTVEGQVVDDSGAPVPLARYWLRELTWPYRSFGTPRDPLNADLSGRFVVGNVFTGSFRITAVSPEVQEVRGDYQGTLIEEGDVSQKEVRVTIGGAGVGSVSITVIDPQLGFATVPNAEVALLRGGDRFDFATTNENGVVSFDDVPAGTNYVVHAFSKSAGRAGNTAAFTVFDGETSSVAVHLEFRGIVSGTLIDPESEPVANAPSKGTPVTLSATGVRTADSTDGNGAFEFLGVPEGNFTLLAQEIGTFRKATGPTGLFISKLVPERRNIQLELERTGTLTVNVYLPNDTGGAGELAPLAEVTVWQGNMIYGPVPYYRGLQGNPVTFRKLLRGMSYNIEVRELGGESRFIKSGGSFGKDEFTKTHNVVLQTSGTVEVQVVDANDKPVEDARVRIHARNMNVRTLYTPASGIVTLPGVPLPGWVSVDAAKDNVTASAGGNLANRTQPLKLKLNLGTYAAAEGFVDAENGLGIPSAGTRVILSATSSLITGTLRLETLTDSMGAYRFTGIPVKNTTLTLTFYGPDDTTIGAARTVTVADGTTLITVPRVKLDATPPRVLSIDPPANATNVSPGGNLYVTFSEQIPATYLTNSYFQLKPTDGSAQVSLSFVPSLRPDGTYQVKLVPPAPPAGQKFPLKSNVLYRLTISNSIQDTTGNAMKGAVGTSFTTVNYTEPAVVSVTPPEHLPIPEGTTFRVKFNKAIDESSFQPGNGGLLTLQRLDGYKGNSVENIPVSKFVDPADPTTLVIAPVGVAIAESAFYRITLSGTRDTQVPPNTQSGTKVLEFFSFDTKKPVVTIGSPVAAGESLVSDVLYTATVSVVDSGANTASSDIAYVDWMNASGALVSRVKTKPFSYSFVAPKTSTPTTFTLKASATDLSNNTSVEAASFTWNVVPNEAPKNIVVTNTPDTVYPSGRVTSRVRFTDEGLVVTVALSLQGTNVDGTPYTKSIGSQKITRSSTAVAFAEAVFTHDVPLVVKDGTATIVAAATDSVNKSGTGSAPLTILADTAPPVFVSVLPNAETHYQYNQTYTIELQVKDAETGVARAVFNVAGAEVFNATSGTFNSSTGVTTFKKTITVPPKNADTRIPIVVTAYDNRNNVTTQTREVIYDRLDDETLPKAAWLTPLDGAALPSDLANWQTTLRVRATDNVKVTGVRFESSALAAPITVTAPKSGTTDIFEAKAVLTMPAGSFTITATASDGDPAHDVEMPITIDPVAGARTITTDFNIAPGERAQYEGRSVVARGVKLYITTPIVLKDLILLDGATLGNPEETPLDVTIADRLFVDADSRVDVSGKGYLGGLRKREDNSFTNPSANGRTLGATSTGGAANADGSYAGLGGWRTGTTNAAYGSITEPLDLGSGGGALSSTPGGNGGGAVALRGGAGLSRFVVAGNIHANGWTQATGGSGGSVLLDARALITSPLTRITANGGDGSTTDQHDTGGGGGRVAVRISERFDYDAAAPLLQARGGRNGVDNEGANYVDGGAGTVFLRKPGDAIGALIVSARDDRHASSTHRNGATPLPADLPFDSITIGPRTLARFDAETTATMTVDPTALVVQPNDLPTVSITAMTPAANGEITQSTTLSRTVTASSTTGIRSIRTILSVQPAEDVVYPKWLASYPATSATIAVPSNAPVGTATLKVRVTDRAGRVAESAPVTFNVISNAAPVIQSFDVAPLETYPNKTVNVSATASDDVAVKTIALTAPLPSTVTSQTATKPTPTTMARAFTVSIPATVAGGTEIPLTLSVEDDFPGRIPVTATKMVKILTDSLPPSAAIVTPLPNAEIQESTGATFNVDVNAADAEVAVKRVSVTFEGVESDLALVSGSLYRKTLNVPSVEGSEPVAKTLTVKAFDYQNNAVTRTITIFIKPLIDATAPTLSWTCASPGAMYPAAYEFPIRIGVVANNANGVINGVTSVKVAINNNAPVTATKLSETSYETKYTIPAGTADGELFNVRVVATAQNGAESILLGEIIAMTGTELASAHTIEESDTIYEGLSYIVKTGGTLTVIGTHSLKNVTLLGGKLVQKSAGKLTVDRLYVGCGSSVDVTALGYARNTSYPGIGPAAASTGGGHIGTGGRWSNIVGYPFGSIYRPMEAGGGGHTAKTNTGGAGGGVIRLHAKDAVIVDGSMLANGFDNTAADSGAGAGGSIWITTPGVVGGGGTISARGGGDSTASNRGTGGGGAIAIEYGVLRGTVRNNLVVRGGKTGTSSSRGAAGSIYLKGPQSEYGDLTIDNTGVASTVESELPFFGEWTASEVANDGSVSLTGRQHWLPPFVAGNWVRVTAPDGTVRGTWRVAGVINSPNARTLGITDVWASDGLAYEGYVFYSDTGYPVANGRTRQLFTARYNNGTWEWDNNDGGFVPFAPKQGEFIVASFAKTAQGITRLERVICGSACPAIHGIATLQLVEGVLRPNVIGGDTTGDPYYATVGEGNPSEMQAWGGPRGPVFTDAVPPRITLESGAVIQPGDRVRGVYRFDTLTLKNAAAYTNDLLEVTAPPVLDATSALVTGNPGAPLIDASKITVTRNAHGVVLTGAAGAITDPDQPVMISARNTRFAPLPALPEFSSLNRVAVENRNLGWNYAPGFNMSKTVDNPGDGTAVTATPISDYGWIQFRSGAADRDFSVKLQNGNHGFNLISATTSSGTGTYNVIANNATVSGKNGSYTTRTRFRIEVLRTIVRWYVDGTKVHELAVTPGATQVLFTLSDDLTLIREIEYDPAWSGGRIFAASDGSFSLRVSGVPGDEIALSAVDRARDLYYTDERVVGEIPSDFGVSAITFAQPNVTGGRTIAATVTLLAPAPSDGALVGLSSSNTALATVPATVTVPAGATSATFNITTAPVLAPATADIRATWGGTFTTATLNVVKDTVAPAVTVVTPAANAEFVEGNPNTIAVHADVIEEDSGLSRVYATFEGVETNLTKNTSKGPNAWTGTLNVPYVSGTENVVKQLTISALDNSANSGSSSVSIQVKPIVDARPPSVAFVCATPGAMYPAGTAQTIRIRAVKPDATAPNPNNPIHTVALAVTDANGASTTVPAVSAGGDLYDATYTVPNGADNSAVTLQAVVTTTSGSVGTADNTIKTVTGATTITDSITISSANTDYDTKTVVINPNLTVTIAGQHTFQRLILLPGAKIVHAAATSSASAEAVRISVTGDAYIACGASIDTSGRGYPEDVVYPGAAALGNNIAGSHMGRGGRADFANATFGSVTRPQELGTSSWVNTRGGGAVRLVAQTLLIDGAVRSNGTNVTSNNANAVGGSGGSVWITANALGGTGTIEADAGLGCTSGGGGGAVSVEYTSTVGALPAMSARGGLKNPASCTTFIAGAPGTIYVKGPQSVYGDLTLTALGAGTGTTDLPALGNGTAAAGSSGTSLVTDRATNIPAYFEGHWVRITSASGTVKGTWRAGKPVNKTIPLIANAGETINVAAGDKWAGLYRFDTMTLDDVTLVSGDTIETTSTNIEAGTTTASAINASATLRVKSGAFLTHASSASLVINAGTVQIDAGGEIDTTGKGYPEDVTYTGANPLATNDGGSHIGRGGRVDELGATFGSITQPQELGTSSWVNTRGGGAIRINATDVILNGAIRANGTSVTSNNSGAVGGSGGSVWITTASLGGTGTIEADAGNGCVAGGGGGAVSVTYSTQTGALPSMFARGGVRSPSSCSTTVFGAPGSVYVKRPALAFGNVTIDAAGRGTGITELPSIGSGLAANGSGGATLVTDRAADIPPAFKGHIIELASASGFVKGRWRVAQVSGKTVTLEPSGSATPNVAAGDRWRGVHEFDTVKLRSATVLSPDRIYYVTLDKDSSPLTHNLEWPKWNSVPAVTGTKIAGAAGAVTDADGSIKLVAKNNRTGALSAQITVSGNSAFEIPVTGLEGDTFTVFATDGHTFPLTSHIAASGDYGDAPKIVMLITEPEIVTAGESAIGTVRIDKPARAGGEVVTLSSSHPTVFTVPASITIPAGATSGTFPITTGQPAVATHVTVSATLRATQTTDSFVVPAASAISSLTLDQTTVDGGTAVTATITLSGPAPAPWADVEVFTSDTVLARVFSPNIPEGSTSATFTITTAPVAATTPVTITAVYGGTRSAELTLTACSAMPAVSPIANVPLLWFDDAPPANATVTGDAVFDATQAGSGTKSLHFTAANGVRTWSMSGAAPLNVTPDDELVFHLLVNPCNPPREVLVTWSDGTSNWSASWGENRIDPSVPRFHVLPSIAGWARLEATAAALGITANKAVNKLTISVDGGEAWIDAVGAESCWGPISEISSWPWNHQTWFASVPSGNTTGCQSVGADVTQQCVTGLAALPVGAGDVLFAHAEIDACNPPDEVMLQWYDGTTWKSRAFWGRDVLPLGTPNTSSKVRAGALPQKAEKMRLEVPASLLELEGTSVTGFAFTVAGGTATASDIGKYDRANIARAAAMSQSSTFVDDTAYAASKASDGDNATLSATKSQTQPWLQLDLGDVQPIDDIVILNRTDAEAVRLTDFSILVSDTPFGSDTLAVAAATPNVSRYAFGGTAGASTTFDVNREGRYIRLQLSGADILTVREVQVWANASEARTNIAGGRSDALVFVDGRANAASAQSDVIDIDLDAVRPIRTLELIGESAADVYVLLSDVPFASNELAVALQQAGVYAMHFAELPDAHVPIHRRARYIRVQKAGANAPSLSEIRVWSQQEVLDVLSVPAPSSKN
jgi:Bacterial Ig-like domain/F5/8 type C domain